jgi:hypothetical protein
MSTLKSLAVAPHRTRILVSIVWIVAAVWLIVHGNKLGWILLPGWLLVAALWAVNAFKDRPRANVQ